MTTDESLDQLIPRLTPALLREVEALIADQHTVAAIQHLRQHSGMTLRWCRDLALTLRAGDADAFRRLLAGAVMPALIELEVQALLVQGQHSKAGTLLSRHTDWGSETIQAYLEAFGRAGNTT